MSAGLEQASPAWLLWENTFAPLSCKDGRDSRIALVAGSFDPITVGHEQLLRRAAARFSKVYLTGFINPEKRGLFGLEERLSFLRAVCRRYDNAEADICTGYLADYAAEKGITVVVKGYRNETDLTYEKWQAEENHRRNPSLQTLLWKSDPAYAGISSTLVRKMLEAGDSEEARKALQALLPEDCSALIREVYQKAKNGI